MTDLAQITLAKGAHDDTCDDPQRCLFEWYNFLTRAKHTDACPPGVSPILHRFGMQLQLIGAVACSIIHRITGGSCAFIASINVGEMDNGGRN